ncbi:hypothetical protein TNCV_162671 [Trichonephila clavipes]|nr:hypothetical protein TNCV_162671 [Trichonephila clavipes]
MAIRTLIQHQEFSPPISPASEAATLTTLPCHILPTNQQSLIHKSPFTSGHIQLIRYGMVERFAFHFPETFSIFAD